jgi:hypothetical protein
MSAGQVEHNRAALVKQVADATAIAQRQVWHESARQRVTVTSVVADVGAGEQVRHVFSDARLLQ